jgi:AcrR family transcriptional regulator
MPQKGSRKLTPSERANIKIDKDMRGITKMSLPDIAEKHGVSKATVNHITDTSLTGEARKIYLKKKKKLEELSLDTTLAALEKGKELILQADHPRHLSGIAAMGKMSDTVHRLETMQPTEITQNNSAEAHALDFIKLLLQRMDLESALASFQRANLDPLVPEMRKPDIIRRIESGELKLLPSGG